MTDHPEEREARAMRRPPARSERSRGRVFARLLEVVRRIPRGRVATYGQVARLAGLPRHARHVGYALHGQPEGTPLPWHRVVNARGAISLRGYGGGAETQRLRLEREGVAFDARGRVSLERHRWPGPRASRGGAPTDGRSRARRDAVRRATGRRASAARPRRSGKLDRGSHLG